MDFAKQDPQFRFDILAANVLRRVVELKAPHLLPLHDQVQPHIESVANSLLGPQSIAKVFGVKVQKVRSSGRKRTAKAKVKI